jgi:uncharacterized protein YndB with AHSA1/START domain
VSDGKLAFEVQTVVDRPVEEVFDHWIEPGLLSSYFTSHASGPIEEGADVRWSWPEGPSETVHVERVERNRLIVFTWPAFQVKTITRVTVSFEALARDRTRVTVAETGWQDDAAGAGAKSAFEHCAGWQHMLLCLKARLRFGVDLRG